ncbi:NnrU family protein [Salinarimonas soli]|uniref:NnrU family protein n=1 Tax=Salinarimonas soli TaxID=1638099 RepID=A0A5B2VY90_9HYPH|nr:NnrU family protein [Salinarimonas soli]KAA2244005.1 NnrU family protein [Salinarimonas soli]
MTLLILGLILFLGTHAFTMARGPRERLIARLGEGPYKGGYSLLSLAGLVLVGAGYDAYRAGGYIPVWNPPFWFGHISLLLMLAAFILFVAAYVPGRIKATVKHPMLAGVKVWALAHLLANGDLGSMLLFGSFLAWAVAARINVKHRSIASQHLGPAVAAGGLRNDLMAVGIGTAAYLAFAVWLHPWLIGVNVLPGR